MQKEIAFWSFNDVSFYSLLLLAYKLLALCDRYSCLVTKLTLLISKYIKIYSPDRELSLRWKVNNNQVVYIPRRKRKILSCSCVALVLLYVGIFQKDIILIKMELESLQKTCNIQWNISGLLNGTCCKNFCRRIKDEDFNVLPLQKFPILRNTVVFFFCFLFLITSE